MSCVTSQVSVRQEFLCVLISEQNPSLFLRLFVPFYTWYLLITSGIIFLINVSFRNSNMTIISKLLPALRTTKTITFVPVITKVTKGYNTRCYSTDKDHSLAKSKERAEVSTDVRPLGEKIKETTKTVSYTGVILLGIGVTGIIFFYVFRELFSSNSANSIYSVALEKCKNVSMMC